MILEARTCSARTRWTLTTWTRRAAAPRSGSCPTRCRRTSRTASTTGQGTVAAAVPGGVAVQGVQACGEGAEPGCVHRRAGMRTGATRTATLGG